MLKVKDLAVTYGSDENPTVSGIDLEMEKGQIVAIVGESGSGKTTVIRAILGALPSGGRVSEGEILFKGESLLSYNESQWRSLRGSRISMIFQDSGAMMNPIRKIGSQYIEYIRTHEKMPKAKAKALAEECLLNMHLSDPENIMNSYPFELSGGQRQRVGIAMAMTFKPDLLLCDEPTSALDVTTQAQIVRQMMELKEEYKTGIIIVTHNIGVAAYMADEIIVMKDGRIEERGNKDKVLYAPEGEYTRELLKAVPTMKGERFV